MVNASLNATATPSGPSYDEQIIAQLGPKSPAEPPDMVSGSPIHSNFQMNAARQKKAAVAGG